MYWTKEMDDRLRDFRSRGVASYLAAERLGVSQASVRSRAARLQIPFPKSKTRRSPRQESNHIPFTPRCGEILRQHGWRI